MNVANEITNVSSDHNSNLIQNHISNVIPLGQESIVIETDVSFKNEVIYLSKILFIV